MAKRRIRAVEELTSRKSGTDIPKILERLEIVFNQAQDAQREADRKAGGASQFFGGERMGPEGEGLWTARNRAHFSRDSGPSFW